jgi:hypothetical protein
MRSRIISASARTVEMGGCAECAGARPELDVGFETWQACQAPYLCRGINGGHKGAGGQP